MCVEDSICTSCVSKPVGFSYAGSQVRRLHADHHTTTDLLCAGFGLTGCTQCAVSRRAMKSPLAVNMDCVLLAVAIFHHEPTTSKHEQLVSSSAERIRKFDPGKNVLFLVDGFLAIVRTCTKLRLKIVDRRSSRVYGDWRYSKRKISRWFGFCHARSEASQR